MNFYQREGLEIQREDFDQATGEKEYVMIFLPSIGRTIFN